MVCGLLHGCFIGERERGRVEVKVFSVLLCWCFLVCLGNYVDLACVCVFARACMQVSKVVSVLSNLICLIQSI